MTNSHMRVRQRRLQKCLGNALLLGAARCVHYLPLSTALALGRGIGWLAPRLSRRHYRRICDDVAAAFHLAEDATAVQRIAYASYRRLGENLMEFLRLPYMSGDAIRRWATLEGKEHIDAALARGNGAIMLTAHVGNWEITGAVFGMSEYPSSAIAREQKDSEITELFTRVRETHGLRVVPMQNVRECIRRLRQNELLGVLGDMNARNPQAFVQFFGRPASTYTGIAYLAELTGAAILPTFSERVTPTQYRVRVYPEIPRLHTGDRQQNIFHTTIRIQQVIEDEVRRRPEDWYWLLRRWKTTPDDAPDSKKIPMEHRDLTPEESAALRHWESGNPAGGNA